jgi:DNA-binding PadR family transcriptional regulator
MSLIGDTKLDVLLRLREEPAHGYELAKELNISSGYVYSHLDDLQEAGVIEVHQTESEGRERTTYSLTENGEMLLTALGE